MRIGNLSIPDGAGLAPMAGITDCSFRPLCFAQGARFAVTEMLSANGFLHISRNVRALEELLRRAPGEPVVGAQLFGHDARLMAEAAQALQARFDFIDINMGCPVHKIVGNGDGSALLRAPEKIGPLVRAVADAVRCPVTVKIRSGWDQDSVNAPLVARIAQDNGAAAVTIHARTRAQFYAGKADWSVIRDVKRAVSIPVIGNGDVRSGYDAKEILKTTGCDHVMVGRAAQGNPWIFREIAAALENRPYSPPDIRERARAALFHMDSMIALRGEKGALLEMRKHIAWYLSGMRGAAQFRREINGMRSLDEVRRALTESTHPLGES